MDIFATCIALAGIEPPQDRILDGHDLTPVLKGEGSSPRQTVFYYRGTRLMAVRHGPWKAHYITQGAYGPDAANPQQHSVPLLFHLEVDPSERHNVAADHPDILETIQTIVDQHRANLDAPPSQLEIPLPG